MKIEKCLLCKGKVEEFRKNWGSGNKHYIGQRDYQPIHKYKADFVYICEDCNFIHYFAE